MWVRTALVDGDYPRNIPLTAREFRAQTRYRYLVKVKMSDEPVLILTMLAGARPLV